MGNAHAGNAGEVCLRGRYRLRCGERAIGRTLSSASVVTFVRVRGSYWTASRKSFFPMGNACVRECRGGWLAVSTLGSDATRALEPPDRSYDASAYSCDAVRDRTPTERPAVVLTPIEQRPCEGMPRVRLVCGRRCCQRGCPSIACTSLSEFRGQSPPVEVPNGRPAVKPATQWATPARGHAGEVGVRRSAFGSVAT